MLPTEQFSGDAVPQEPWTPQVWRDGPDKLIAEARQALFQDRADVEGALDGGTSTPAMDGFPQEANESEEYVRPGNPPEGPPGPATRAQVWKDSMTKLRATEPLAGTVRPVGFNPPPEEANPAP